jgi:septal ring factor EnvC (AmiA/AmiB activator)
MLAAGAVMSVCLAACSTAPTCKVSPVELEELREDIAVLQADLKKARDREAELSTDLATKKADLETKKEKPAELRAKLDHIKKGSGKTEKPKTDAKEPVKKGSS